MWLFNSRGYMKLFNFTDFNNIMVLYIHQFTLWVNDSLMSELCGATGLLDFATMETIFGL